MKPTPLTVKEIEILRAYAAGKRTIEIAEDRFLSVKSIDTYRHNILMKTGAKTIAEAVALGIKKKVILL